MPGIYLPAGILANTSSTERQEITFIARLAALSIRYPTYVLSGPSAAFLLGLPTACRLKELFVYMEGSGFFGPFVLRGLF